MYHKCTGVPTTFFSTAVLHHSTLSAKCRRSRHVLVCSVEVRPPSPCRQPVCFCKRPVCEKRLPAPLVPSLMRCRVRSCPQLLRSRALSERRRREGRGRGGGGSGRLQPLQRGHRHRRGGSLQTQRPAGKSAAPSESQVMKRKRKKTKTCTTSSSSPVLRRLPCSRAASIRFSCEPKATTTSRGPCRSSAGWR